MKSPLELLEARFKGLFEGKPSVKDWIQDRPDSVQGLINEIDRYLLKLSGESEPLPAQFLFYLSREDTRDLGSETGVEEMIADVMTALGTEYGLVFSRNPRIKIVTRNSLPPGEIEIKPFQSKERVDQTDSISVQRVVLPLTDERPSNQAILLLADETIFSLTGPVTNLGRKSNNHIVFDDLRVSRNHAQIRLIFGEYVLFDTGSSGGTFLNGERVSQSTLKSGDVISLAGVKLIFSREKSSSDTGEREITSKLGPVKKEE